MLVESYQWRTPDLCPNVDVGTGLDGWRNLGAVDEQIAMTEQSKSSKVPIGLAHIAMLVEASRNSAKETEPFLQSERESLELLGTALAAISEVATCRRGCSGGPHTLERLCARVYNISISAYLLMNRGFYDEALNLLRSVGEIGNLMSLRVSEPDVIEQWVAADRKTRLREFSPAAIRKRLEKHDGFMIAEQDWYETFCESYTHATPGMKPNMHNAENRPVAGGLVQEAGIKLVLRTMLASTGLVAIMASRFGGLDDYFGVLIKQPNLFKPLGDV